MTTITGPVRGGAHGWPFGGATVDLAALGYVEEEYFFEGLASRYRMVDDSDHDGEGRPVRVHAERTHAESFKTRAVVRRPVDPGRFNGTVIVEWNNVSAGCDIFEAGDTPVVFDEGFAYMGISAQRVGVHGFKSNPQGLVAWDPERYATLNIADDALSYGIFAEVARTVRPGRPHTEIDPLGHFEVRRLLAVGGSQSAGRLATYINAVEPVERVFDGFIAFTWFGSGSSIDDPATFDPSSDMNRLVSRPTRLRTDLGVPVMVVNSECETLSCHPVRQPDDDHFRYWEVAGAPHGPRLHMERIAPKMARDGVAAVSAASDLSALSPVAWAPVLDAAMVHVDRWIDGGPPPPAQPRIAVSDSDPPHVVRDSDGNAIGGVRVPEMEAPRARHVAAMQETKGGLMGEWFPFDVQVLEARYPDHARYLAAYEAAAQAALRAGVLRRRDVEESIRHANANAPA